MSGSTEKSFGGLGRTDWAAITVKNGKIAKLEFGGDSTAMPSCHEANRNSPIEYFLFCLRNAFDIVMIHNREEFCELLEEIKRDDTEIFYLGSKMLKDYDKRNEEFQKELAEIRKKAERKFFKG